MFFALFFVGVGGREKEEGDGETCIEILNGFCIRHG